jgi:type IV pilus assembly protein PilM
MSERTFGLDIGTTSLRAAQVVKSGSVFSLQSIAVVPQQAKGILSESLADQQALSTAIKKMLDDANLRTKNVNVSILDSQVYTKVIEMPELSEQEAAGALKFQMEQLVPLPLDQVRTDWQILGSIGSNEKKTMIVMIVAAPLVIINKYEKVLSLAGLVPEAIETEIISVHRALLPLVAASGPALLIHIGAGITNVAIVNNGVIVLAFSISFGGIAITRAISVDLAIDLVQAESFKKTYGLNEQAFEGKIGRALTPILDSMVTDIQKAVLSFKQNNNIDIKQIVLSGGTALLPGIDAYFTNKLGIQVVVGNVFDAYNIGNVPSELRVDAPSYNVVMGLALRDSI